MEMIGNINEYLRPAILFRRAGNRQPFDGGYAKWDSIMKKIHVFEKESCNARFAVSGRVERTSNRILLDSRLAKR